MMIRNLYAASITIAVILTGASPSWSADLTVVPAMTPVETTGPSWTGFYIGLHGGGAFGNMGYDELPIPGFPPSSRSYQFGAADFAYGIHGGFDFQFNDDWVAGLELDYTQINASYDPLIAGGFGPLVEAKSIWSVSGRAGYLMTPSTLFYGRLGYAGIRLEAPEGAGGTAEDTVGAAQFGLGIETFLFGNVTGRVEANYYHALDDFTTADFVAFDPHYLLVTAGLSYRFGAQNGSHRSAKPAPDMDWNGFYVGLEGSYHFGVMDFDIAVPGATVGPYGDQSFGGGIFAGYDFVFGSSYLLGAEIGGTYLDARFEDPALNTIDPSGPSLFATVHAMFSATARAGYFATPSTLIYVKGGFAGLLTEANDEFFALGGGDNKFLSGYQVGIGIESALTEKLSLRVEGLYTKALDGLVVNNSQPDQAELTPSLLTARIGLSYRF